MIVNKNKEFSTCNLYTNTDWTNKADFVIPDDSPIAQKILQFSPYFELVMDEKGNLVDVKEIPESERPKVEAPPTLEETVENLGKSLAKEKLDGFKKDKVIAELGKKQAHLSLELMNLKKKMEG